MYTKSQLKRYFIIAIIAAMTISAAVGILAVLIGSFGELQAKILLTTLAVGVFSVTSLANLRNLESGHAGYRRFAWLSILLSLIALLFVIILIWTSLDSDNAPWKPAAIFIILAFSTAHTSLLLASRHKSKLIDALVTTTIACISFVAGFLMYLVFIDADGVGTIYYRLLAVFAILDVLGTIVVPILSKVMKSKDENSTPNPPTRPPAATPPAPSNPR